MFSWLTSQIMFMHTFVIRIRFVDAGDTYAATLELAACVFSILPQVTFKLSTIVIRHRFKHYNRKKKKKNCRVQLCT